jgi:hypothetical protein
LFWELNAKSRKNTFYHRHSYVSLFYRVKAEKTNAKKVKIQDAYFYKKSFKRTGPFTATAIKCRVCNHISL